ncbi:MAG TPA: phosphoheptose isomerase [Candidatus Angelobacter sp.]|nr:phosphoheptose isomerase [Candidatus Angelobacter sp.]
MGKIFIINIDGCICEHVDNEHPELTLSALPYPCSIAKINQWYDQGHFICFSTARTEDHRDVTLTWLRKHGVKHHKLILGKPRRDEGDEYHYIDDTPIRATRYKGVLGDMVKKTKDVTVFEDE